MMNTVLSSMRSGSLFAADFVLLHRIFAGSRYKSLLPADFCARGSLVRSATVLLVAAVVNSVCIKEEDVARAH